MHESKQEDGSSKNSIWVLDFGYTNLGMKKERGLGTELSEADRVGYRCQLLFVLSSIYLLPSY